jgi:hypothetical protein
VPEETHLGHPRSAVQEDQRRIREALATHHHPPIPPRRR